MSRREGAMGRGAGLGWRSRVALVAALVALGAGGGASDARAADKTGTLYMVGASHLDTQWWWTIQTTIDDLLPDTFAGWFDALDEHPGVTFGWEGAFRYMLLEEYHPDLFERLPAYVDAGRWRPAGSAVDAGDVNVPDPESLMRQFLYGNGWFRQRLGVTSLDVFLPDCFGFGFALPTVAAHCGLTMFSTQKLTWGSAVGVPFGIGRWRGVDGSELVAALRPGSYTSSVNGDLSQSERWLAEVEAQQAVSGLPLAMGYFGTGDRGGVPALPTFANLDKSLAGEGPLEVRATAPDQLVRDLTPEQVAALPVYQERRGANPPVRPWRTPPSGCRLRRQLVAHELSSAGESEAHGQL